MRTTFTILSLALLAVPALADQASVAVATNQTIATVDSRYLSFSIDTALIVGGPWWDGSSGTANGQGTVRATAVNLRDTRLMAMARALAPAVLRVGGTEADAVAYDMNLHPTALPPRGYDALLTAARWDELCGFTRNAGLDLMFTLNGGPLERNAQGAWVPDHAQTLLDHASAMGETVSVWELGNEPNAYWLTQGTFLSGDQYARDYEAARTLVQTASPGSKLAGPATAFWPILGEPLGFIFGVTEPFLQSVTGEVDTMTWHFYPTESDRTPLVLRPATLSNMLDPTVLDEVGKWALEVKGWRDLYQPDADFWLGESGPAQCGGEPGLSSTFADSFWWLDQLGLLATLGPTLQVRQDLVGADYGLLDEVDFAPRPDFWASLLWKTLMGEGVYSVQTTGSTNVRAYAHATASRAAEPQGSVTLLLINLSTTDPATVTLSGLNATKFVVYAVTAPSATSKTVSLNGTPLAWGTGGSLPTLQGQTVAASSTVTVAPLSYVFIVAIP